MTDRWKSQPRKFCEYCKCWLTDNKPSIEFHEGGKRHKEAVELRIRAARQKGIADSREKKEMADMLKQIERDALQAMNKDVAEDPTRAAHYNRQLPRGGVRAAGGLADARQYLEMASTAAAQRERFGGNPGVSSQQTGAPASQDLWAELETENGHIYYYNTRTGETSWTNPTASAVTAPPPPPPPDTAPPDTTPKHAVAETAPTPSVATSSGKTSEGAEDSTIQPADASGWFNTHADSDDTTADNDSEKNADKKTPTHDNEKADTGTTESTPSNSADTDGAGKGHGATENAAAAEASADKKDATDSQENADKEDSADANDATKSGVRSSEPGKWNVVAPGSTLADRAAARAVAKKETVDEIRGVDGTEAAVTFVQKATPTLKRPAGAPGAVITMKKKRRQGNQRGRVTKPS
eukprot:m.115970 g.115970  ORF g.115970 m.115970 type:complete len:411 (-) comp17161_c0_seq3:425-1657(-)